MLDSSAVKKTIFSIGSYKAQGTDGFSLIFFKHFGIFWAMNWEHCSSFLLRGVPTEGA